MLVSNISWLPRFKKTAPGSCETSGHRMKSMGKWWLKWWFRLINMDDYGWFRLNPSKSYSQREKNRVEGGILHKAPLLSFLPRHYESNQGRDAGLQRGGDPSNRKSCCCKGSTCQWSKCLTISIYIPQQRVDYPNICSIMTVLPLIMTHMGPSTVIYNISHRIHV